MKKTQYIELFNTIKKTMVSFISISFFVLLGAAIFLGIDWSVTGFKDTVNHTLDEWNMHDVSLTFAYGFSEDEVNKIKQLDYVDKVEAQNSFEASFNYNNFRYQAKVISLTNELDDSHKIVGEIPSKKGEIAFERNWAEKNNIKIGDVITFEHDDDGTAYSIYNLLNEDLDVLQENKKTDDGMMYLTCDTFKVTALVENATYINQYKVTYGVSALTSIPNDCITYVSEESIDLKAFNGYRTVILTSNELNGLNTFDDEYKDKNNEIVYRLQVDLEEYINERNNTIFKAIDNIKEDINTQIKDGEKELEKGEKEIIDGEKKIRDGEKQIVEGKVQLADAKIQLDDAKDELDKGWKEYYAGLNEYNDGKTQVDELVEIYDGIRTAIQVYNFLYDAPSYLHSYYNEYVKVDGSIKQFLDDYASGSLIEDFFKKYGENQYDDDIYSIASTLKDELLEIKNTSDFEDLKAAAKLLDPSTPGVSDLIKLIDIIDNCDTYVNDLLFMYELFKNPILSNKIKDMIKKEIGTDANAIINFIESIDLLITKTYTEVDDIVNEMARVLKSCSAIVDEVENLLNTKLKPQIDSALSQLASAKAQLDNGYRQLLDGQEQYEDGLVIYEEGLAELEENEKLLIKAKQDLLDGKKKLEEGKEELEIAKNKFKDFDDKVNQIEHYDISLLGRNLNGGIGSAIVPTEMMSSIKYTMVLLFVIVGVFVCYSALSRSVYDQTIQIGTKKALGLSRREVTLSFLLYGTFATILGCVLGVLAARYIVEPIILGVFAANYIVADIQYYFSIKDTLLFTLFELAVTNLTSFLACNKALKKKAIKLLQGPEDLIGKSHFYEKLPGWNSLSLLTKTIINNCVNDKRRVLSTLVGVAGCCSLMVCAISLITNMNDSLDYQLNSVAKFDSVAYYDSTVDGSLDNINNSLDAINVEHFAANYSSCAVENNKGNYVSGALFVYDDDKFFDFFEVAQNGVRQEIGDGICIAKAFAQNNNLEVGDYMTILDSVGIKHNIKVTAIFDYYLLRAQTIMTSSSYYNIFGKDPVKNAVLIKRGSYSNEYINDCLYSIDGYISTFDYIQESIDIYSSLTDTIMIVVITFFILAVVLAFLVLLNLLIMFVDEKKKELIVMMINGYSRKKVKTYIYGDTIVLSFIGILIGIVIGVIVGFVTIKSFDSDCVTIMRNINIPSYLICGSLTAILSAISCLIALRKVDKFKLTEINSK